MKKWQYNNLLPYVMARWLSQHGRHNKFPLQFSLILPQTSLWLEKSIHVLSHFGVIYTDSNWVTVDILVFNRGALCVYVHMVYYAFETSEKMGIKYHNALWEKYIFSLINTKKFMMNLNSNWYHYSSKVWYCIVQNVLHLTLPKQVASPSKILHSSSTCAVFF